MEIEELVTKFTVDVSDYRKEVESIKRELHSVAGLTDKVKETTKKALGSSSSEMQRLGRQLQTLTDKQSKNTQSAIESGKKIADFRAKSRLLVTQLNAQREEIDNCRQALKRLNVQYTEQKDFLADYDDGVEGIRRQRQEMLDYIHKMDAAENSAYQTDKIEKYSAEIKRVRDDLKDFDNQLKAVGLDPNNLKTDTLKGLEKQMCLLSSQERQYTAEAERTNAQIKSNNQSIAVETSRYNYLHSSLAANSVSVTKLSSRISALSRTKAADKLKSRFGSAMDSVTAKVKSGFSKIKSTAAGAGKALLGAAKSILKIGVVSPGLKICNSIFSKFKDIVSSCISRNETLNSRIEALNNAFANALAPAVNIVVSLFEKLMPYAVSVADSIGRMFSSLGVSKSINATAKAVNGTADAAENLKKAQADLYGFDEITKVSDDSEGETQSSGTAAYNGDTESIGKKLAESCNSIISSLNALDWEGIQNRINNCVSGIANSLNDFVYDFDWYGAGALVGNGVNTVFGAIDTFLTDFDFKALGSGFANNLNGIFATVDFSVIGKTLSDALTGVFNLLSGFLETLNWQQLAKDTEDIIKGIDWSNMSSSFFESIGAAIGGLSAMLGTWLVDAVSSVKDYFGDKIEENGGDIGAGILQGIADAFKSIGTWIDENIFTPFLDGFKKAFGIASPSKVMKTQGGFITDGLLSGIGNVWSRVKKRFDDFKTNLSNFFTGNGGLQSRIRDFGSGLVTKLSDGLSGLRSKLTECFRGPLNGVIGLVNNMIDRINGYLSISVNGTMSSILGALGVGVSGGRYQLFTIPNIPQLATGGIIEKPTLAMVGERGREAVVPLENNTSWISKIAGMIVEYTNALSNNGSGDIVIPIRIGDERIMVKADKRSMKSNNKFSENRITV